MKHTRQTSMLTHLLKGRYISLNNSFSYFGISNPAREVGRLIERPLGIYLIRKKKEGKSRYGHYTYCFEYRLRKSDYIRVHKYLKSLKK
jgi:hypothetical protein